MSQASQDDRDRWSRRLAVAGGVLLACALLLNARVLAYLGSPDHRIETPLYRRIIVAVQAVLATGGLALCGLRRRVSPVIARRWAQRAMLGAGATVLALAGAEILVRIAWPHPYVRPTEQRLIRYSPTLGWEYVPGRIAISAAPYQYAQRVRISSLGLRDREYTPAKPAGVRRIAVLGDSFTAGCEVREHEVYTEVMERLLGPGWEVLNFGVTGYGPLQELLQLKEKVLSFQPDVVLTAIYVRNDLYDIVGEFDAECRYSRPVAALNEEGRLAIANLPPPVPREIREDRDKWTLVRPTDFHLFNLARVALSAGDFVLVNAYPEIPFFRKDSAARREYVVLREILKSMKETAASVGARTAVVIIPTIVQVYPEAYWPKIRDARGLVEGEYDLEFPNRVLANLCAELEIPVADLLDALRARARKGEKLYYLWNQHWNARAHEVAGNALVDFLAREGLTSQKER